MNAFGVVLFEVLCGRPAVDKSLDEEQIGLAGWAQHCFREKRLGEIIDPGIEANMYPDSLEMFVKVAIQCLHTGPKHRPTMAEVVVGLESAFALQEKSTENFSSEIITSDDNQEEIDISDSEVEERDISDSEVENGNSDNEMDGISGNRHQEKKSSSFLPEKEKHPSAFKRFFAFLTVPARNTSVIRDSKPVILRSSNLKLYTFSETELPQDTHDTYYKGYVDKRGTGLVTTTQRWKDTPDFEERCLKELNILGKLCHPNIVELIGYCSEKKHWLEKLEYPPHPHLDWPLWDSDSWPFSWKLRISIAHGAAKGLAYLHSPGVNVIHGDVKTSNILIDSKYDAKLSIFCCTKDGPGTFGYLDPVYVETGTLTMKSDVFAFGVVLLELLTGREADDPPEANEERALFSWAESRLSEEYVIISDLMDAHMRGQYTVEEALTAFSLALRCTSLDTKSRPDAKQVAEELEQLLSLINFKDTHKRRPVIEFETERSLASSVQSHGILDIMDASMEGQYTVEEASTASSLALRCTSSNSKSRPDAKQVAEELEQLLSSKNFKDKRKRLEQVDCKKLQRKN